MKKILTIFLAFICFLNTNAQDTITLKNKKLIYAHIIEKNNTKIKYTLDSVSNIDATYSLKLCRIRTIHYNDGKVDLLSSQNPRSIFPLGIYSGIGLRVQPVVIMLTGSIDYMFTPNISAEINFGKGMDVVEKDFIYYYYSFGGKYWFANKYSKSGFSSFVGLQYGNASGYNMWEAPVGISYITKFGFQASFQLSYTYYTYLTHLVEFPNIELKIGWRFKTEKM
ncbi:MAG: hypothetical protein BGO29_07125 [Bacteroidales bacterium 36-12]|nr:MAG: hypothetical protein BGO29_07125 [Bacteroidales bacterium 36-12]